MNNTNEAIPELRGRRYSKLISIRVGARGGEELVRLKLLSQQSPFGLSHTPCACTPRCGVLSLSANGHLLATIHAQWVWVSTSNMLCAEMPRFLMGFTPANNTRWFTTVITHICGFSEVDTLQISPDIHHIWMGLHQWLQYSAHFVLQSEKRRGIPSPRFVYVRLFLTRRPRIILPIASAAMIAQTVLSTAG